MDNNYNTKKKTLIVGILSTLIILLGSTYAFFTYSKSLDAYVITSGEVTAVFTDGTNVINFGNAYPISDEYALSNLDKLNYTDFTVSSNIVDQNQVISYELYLTEEANNTLERKYVKLYLTDTSNNQLASPVLYSSLNGTSNTVAPQGRVIYTDSNTGTFTKTFRLYTWLDSSYEQNDVSQTFSFKVNLYAYNGNVANLPTIESESPVISNISYSDDGKITFTATDNSSGVSEYCVNQRKLDTTDCTWLTATSGSQTTDAIATTSGTYYIHVKDTVGNIGHSSGIVISTGLTATEFATEQYGTNGLIAVNTSGTLYDGTGTIREYRYSGPTVNNYVEFNNGEIWRIIGVFQNSAGQWNYKLMRNTVLTSEELPSTYTYGGTSFTIEEGTSGYAYWNKSGTTDNNDWTTAGLQYYLNGSDGYYGTLSSGAQTLVDTSYTYYLGNVGVYNTEQDTAISAYTNERKSTVCGSGITSNTHTNNCDIWYGNKAIWNGKVALLYPSDYGYSASSTHWNSTTLHNYETGSMDTSWMFTTANHTTIEWMLSPTSYYSYIATRWDTSGYVRYFSVTDYFNTRVRPVLNLKSTATIDTNHQGTEADPYIVVE